MSEVKWERETFAPMACCLCGSVVSQPNGAKMCLNCIKSEVDVSEDIPKRVSISWCKGCGRYHEPPSRWMICAPESKELLSFCLRRIRGLNKVKLVDAVFLWTELHSKRVKLKLTCQKVFFESVVVEQTFVVEFIVCNFFCPDCHKHEAGGAENSWRAVAQVRQHVRHKRTFYWLEQCILKYRADEDSLFIKECPEGLDFYFSGQGECRRFVEFVCSVVPARYQVSKKLISHDTKSNFYSHKYSYSVELAPICRDDLVLLTPKLSAQLGGFSPLCIAYKISNQIRILDPFTFRVCELGLGNVWSNSCRSVATKGEMAKFLVLNTEAVDGGECGDGAFTLCDATIVRPVDFGENDNQFFVVTHLGGIISPGDEVLGYDLANVNLSQEELELLGKYRFQIPEMLLVKKHRDRSMGRRKWKLKSLEMRQREGGSGSAGSMDYETFLQELEENPEMRPHVNFYASDDTECPLPLDPDSNMNELIDNLDGMQLSPR